jgi:hypothetical protein
VAEDRTAAVRALVVRAIAEWQLQHVMVHGVTPRVRDDLADRLTASLADHLAEVDRLHGLLRALYDAQAAHEDADVVAMRATFNDAPDTADCLEAMDATARALDDAWSAVSKELGEAPGEGSDG